VACHQTFAELVKALLIVDCGKSSLIYCSALGSDVKRGQNLEAEAEANFWRLKPRPRPKIIMKKVPNIMINNIRFEIIAGKINKISEFYTIFCPKNAGVGLWLKTVKCMKHCNHIISGVQRGFGVGVW